MPGKQADSKALTKMIKNGIDSGFLDEMIYIEYLIQVSEMVEILKEDKIELYKYFRAYKLKLKGKL